MEKGINIIIIIKKYKTAGTIQHVSVNNCFGFFQSCFS